MPRQTAQARENALEAYKQLAELLRHEEALFWKRMETFLLISSGLIAAVGLVWPSKEVGGRPPLFLGVAVSVIGMAICLGWLVVVARSEAFYNHWYEQIVHLEKTYIQPADVFQKADKYFADGKITIGEKEFTLGRIASIAHIYHVMFAAPIVFFILWLGFLAYTVIGWVLSLGIPIIF
jgi:hypothetical protein